MNIVCLFFLSLLSACQGMRTLPERQAGPSMAISTWMRAPTSDEQVDGCQRVALEIRLAEAASLQRWQLPEGLTGILENADKERLNTFPLSTTNTLFLCLDKGQQLDEESCMRLWIQHEAGTCIEKEVPFNWRQTAFPFDLALKVRDAVFARQQTPVTLTLAPQDPAQKTAYTLTDLTLSAGVLKEADSGVVLTAGTSLTAGTHPLLFVCPDAATDVCLRLMVRNTQGDQRTFTQYLRVQPAGLLVNTWLHALPADAPVLRPGQEGVAVHIRLEGVPATKQPFTLQRITLPQGLQGRLVNEAQEPLRSFPLHADQTNTIFLVFDPRSNVTGAAITFQVQGPHGRCAQGRIAYAALQQVRFQEQAALLFSQLRPDDRGALDKNLSLLKALDKLAAQGAIPAYIRRGLAPIRRKLVHAQSVQAIVSKYGSVVAAVQALCELPGLREAEGRILRTIIQPGMLLKDGQCPLRVAAYHMNLEAVQLLLTLPYTEDGQCAVLTPLSGFIVHCYTNSRGSEAMSARFDAVFEALVASPALRDERNDTGQTPLMYAAGVGAVALIKQLIGEGAVVTARTTKMANFRVHCYVERYRMIINNAVKHGGEFRNVYHWTALHEAVAQKQWACADFLRSLKVDWPQITSESYFFKDTAYETAKVQCCRRGFYIE